MAPFVMASSPALRVRRRVGNAFEEAGEGAAAAGVTPRPAVGVLARQVSRPAGGAGGGSSLSLIPRPRGGAAGVVQLPGIGGGAAMSRGGGGGGGGGGELPLTHRGVRGCGRWTGARRFRGPLTHSRVTARGGAAQSRHSRVIWLAVLLYVRLRRGRIRSGARLP